jgi:CheY-like chemotaxis protein
MVKEILLVDDEQEDLDNTKKILEDAGYKIEVASDGAQALDKLINKSFDLILLDIQMPTLSGYDLLRLLREKVNHSVKMVYMSIVPEKEVDMSDIDGFIQKPFGPEDLLSLVKKILGE